MLKINKKIDYHVHIGQWSNVYYSPESVLDSLKASNVEEVWFSSTSSCGYCKESFDVISKNLDYSNFPTALELYNCIKNEVLDAMEYGKKIGLRVAPLYWVIPEIHFSTSANISIEKTMKEVPYKGFKLHPRGNHWDLSDKKTQDLAEEVFAYANKHNLPILIHCGYDDFENPKLFEKFIAKSPNAKVQLAHCKPVEDTIYMLKKYPNTVCDTAFVPEDVFAQIVEAGFEKRIRYGSDFPITHWYAANPKENPSSKELVDFIIKYKNSQK